MVEGCVCGDRATYFCYEEDAYLCEECDAKLHENSAEFSNLLKRHNRIQISKVPIKFGNCEEHPESKVGFFCEKCETPLCIKCKMLGTHAKGEAHDHELIEIENAYGHAKSDISDDPSLRKKKGIIDSQMNRIQDKIQYYKISNHFKSDFLF